MQPLLARTALFFSSYCPFAVICVVLFWGKQTVVVFVSLTIIVVGIGALGYFVWRANSKSGVDQLTITSYQKRDENVMSYVITYLIPFIALNTPGKRVAFAYIILLALIAWIYVNSNMIYINPMLNLCGYHLYEVKLKRRREKIYYLLARKPFESDDTLSLIAISEDIYLQKWERHLWKKQRPILSD